MQGKSARSPPNSKKGSSNLTAHQNMAKASNKTRPMVAEAKPLKSAAGAATGGKPKSARGGVSEIEMPEDPYGMDEWEDAWNTTGPYAKWIMVAVVAPQVVFVLVSGTVCGLSMAELMQKNYSRVITVGEWLPLVYSYTILGGIWFIIAMLFELQLKPVRSRSRDQTWPMPSISMTLSAWSMAFSLWALILLSRIYNGEVLNVIENNNEWRLAMALLMMGTGCVIRHVLVRTLHCARVKLRIKRAAMQSMIKKMVQTANHVQALKRATPTAAGDEEEEPHGADLDDDSGSGSDSHEVEISF